MKNLFLTIALFLVSVLSFAQSHVWVNGHTRSNGTYVAGHYRTAPDQTKNNNWSTVGNVNPYTGKAGTLPGDSGRIAYRSYTPTTTYHNSPVYRTSPSRTTYSSSYRSVPMSNPYLAPVYNAPVSKPSTKYTKTINSIY